MYPKQSCPIKFDLIGPEPGCFEKSSISVSTAGLKYFGYMRLLVVDRLGAISICIAGMVWGWGVGRSQWRAQTVTRPS